MRKMVVLLGLLVAVLAVTSASPTANADDGGPRVRGRAYSDAYGLVGTLRRIAVHQPGVASEQRPGARLNRLLAGQGGAGLGTGSSAGSLTGSTTSLLHILPL